MTILTTSRLIAIRSELTDRDRRLLALLRQLRYMKTDQIRRVFFAEEDRTLHARKVATYKALNRLMGLGLISHLPKRIGGVRAGSQGIIWYLTEAGARLLDLGTEMQYSRKRQLEPSPIFLRHTIAVTETYVQVTEICASDPAMRMKTISVEPKCWRSFQKGGKNISLRPDLYTETTTGEFEDHIFIEMDLDTEPPRIVVEKCRRYLEYYRTGKEQKERKLFPLVLWIAPNEERKERLIEAIKNTLSKHNPHIFYVIVPEELEEVLRDGFSKEKLC